MNMRNQVLNVCAAAILVTASAGAVTVHTAADGSTFDVTGGTLTITVPSGVTQSSYDYVANVLNKSEYAVTAVVKDGPGVLEARSAASYTGSWTIQAGVVTFKVANAFGSTSGTPATTGAITVMSGASIQSDSKDNTSLNNRRVFIAGAGDGSSYKGALIGTVQGTTAPSQGMIKNAQIGLTGDATIWGAASCTMDFMNGTTVDLAGRTLNLSGGAWHNFYVYKAVITNSDEVAAATVKSPLATNYKVHLRDSVWRGGSRNVLDMTGNGRNYIEGKVDTDWTVKMKGSVRGSRSSNPLSATNSYYLTASSFVVNGSATVGNADSTDPGYGLQLNGPITGNASSSLTVNRGAWVSFNCPVNTYEGSFTLSGGGNDTYRPIAYFQAGTPFLTSADKTVSVSDSDIWMDPTTVRSISNLSITKGRSTITGSAAGSTIPSLTISGGATNILNTPASIATVNLSNGRLVFGGTLPAIGNLICSAGTVIDLNGKNVSVDVSTNAPSRLENGGTLAVAQWAVDVGVPDVVYPAELVVSGTDPIPVSDNGGPLAAGTYTVLHIVPGASFPDLSRLTGVVDAGMSATFATNAVTTGPYAGYIALTVSVGPTTVPQDTSYTDADGTTFEVSDRVLTITVPSALTTNSYDYSALVADNYVTNIVKKGDGGLLATAMPDYCGDFTVSKGYFIVGETGDLGREHFGVVRVVSPGGLAVKNNLANNGLIKNKTIYLEGTGPDGYGAIRGPSQILSNMYSPLENISYVLTGDALHLHNGTYLHVKNSNVDVAGHTLTFRARTTWAQMGYFVNSTVTNSVPSQPGMVKNISASGATSPKLQIDGPSSWYGGTNNVIAPDYRAYLGKTDGNWTLSAENDSVHVWGNISTATPDATSGGYFTGPLRINANCTIGINDVIYTNASRKTTKPYPVSFYGPIVGRADKKLTFTAPTHLYSPASDFPGTVVMDGTMSTNRMNPVFRAGVYLHDAAVFPGGAGKTVEVTDMDLHLDASIACRFPPFMHKSGTMTVSGGSRGDTVAGRAAFASFKKTSTGLLTFDSPAMVTGVTQVTKGTFALGTNMPNHVRSAAELPVFSNLVFAAGTTFDMNGNALAVPNFTGAPTLANPGALTVGESLTADGTNLVDGVTLTSASSLTFAEDAEVRLLNPARLNKDTTYLLCMAAGGITLPSGGELPVSADLPANGWRAVLSTDAKSLTLTYVPMGTMLIFR